MQDTPVPSFFAALSATERATLFTDTSLRTLQAAFASIPDPRKRRGHGSRRGRGRRRVGDGASSPRR